MIHNPLWIYCFLFFLASTDVEKQHEKAHPLTLCILLPLCVALALPLEEGGGEDRVSCNYIYVGSHSVCHSKFCLTCHIVNHYSRLNAGYELKGQKRIPFLSLIALFVCF